MQIYNCHVHTFTHKNVPERFLPFRLTKVLNRKWLRKPVCFILKWILPITDRDLLDRYVKFVNISYKKSQTKIFENLRGSYPLNSRFIVLPVDMKFMGNGDIPEDIEKQHEELAMLRDKYPENVIPFIAADPRRLHLLHIVRRLKEDYDFKGIKIYPALGFFPSDANLYPVYEFASEQNLPVMAHCSLGGVYAHKKINKNVRIHPDTGERLEKKKPKKFANYYTDPDNYIKVLKDFPKLKICLGHFGGIDDWKNYLEKSWTEKNNPLDRAWLSKIIDMIKSGDYPNLYTDIAYIASFREKSFSLLKTILADEKVRHKVLFGSDFYMAKIEKMKEKELSIKLRGYLGEDLFQLIAEQNPRMFLGEKN